MKKYKFDESFPIEIIKQAIWEYDTISKNQYQKEQLAILNLISRSNVKEIVFVVKSEPVD